MLRLIIFDSLLLINNRLSYRKFLLVNKLCNLTLFAARCSIRWGVTVVSFPQSHAGVSAQGPVSTLQEEEGSGFPVFALAGGPAQGLVSTLQEEEG
jgi:hypothetical protein